MEHEHSPGERCVICEEGWDAYRAKTLDLISKFGWVVQGVGGSETSPPFLYSVGLCQLGLPEIIVVGAFPPNLVKKLINNVGNKMKTSGAFVDWSRSIEITKMFSVVFRELSAEAATEHCRMVAEFFGTGRKVLQLILPDKDGKFPWDNDCEWKFQAEGLPISYATPDYMAHIN